MKMKIAATAFIFLFFASSALAQTSDAETDAIVNLLGVQKKEAMSKMVNIAAKDSSAFWKLYDEYNEQNKKTGKQRMKLYERTAQAYGNMSDKIADSLAKAYFTNRVDQEKMLESYYQKIKSATNATTAFEFYQGEVYLLTSLRAQIMKQIPTYGEIIRAQANQNRRP
jgi:hypothetical protein